MYKMYKISFIRFIRLLNLIKLILYAVKHCFYTAYMLFIDSSQSLHSVFIFEHTELFADFDEGGDSAVELFAVMTG